MRFSLPDLSRVVGCLVLFVCAFGAPRPALATLVGLSPNDFSSLGAFNPGTNVVVDTSTLSMTGGVTATGVTSSVAGPNGAVEIAVFTFDSINLSTGLSIDVTGTRPLALLSQGSATLAGTIDASGRRTDRADSEPGPGGGAGGELADGAPFDGFPAVGAPSTSVGRMNTGANGGGGGGAFGGDGGTGSRNGSPTGAGGTAFGDLSLVIQGGSGGGGARSLSAGQLPSGGGGGGGVEIGAVNMLEILGTGLIDVNAAPGGNGFLGLSGGGGGAGGGILLHGFHVNVAGTLTAEGGVGGSGSQGGGGGGGGRIFIGYSATGSLTLTGSTLVLGGVAGPGAGASNGQNGTIDIVAFDPPSSDPIVPEPATVALGLVVISMMNLRRRQRTG